MMPATRLHRRASTAPLGGPGIGHLDERRPVVDTDHERVAGGGIATAVQRGIGLRRGWLDPHRQRERRPGSLCQQRRRRECQGRLTGQTQAGADNRSLSRLAGALRVIGPHRRVDGWRAALVEVIDQQRVRIVGTLGIRCAGRFLVAVIEPDLGLGARLHVRHRNPDQRFAEKRIVLLEVIFQRRLVVAGNEPQIAAVILGRSEAEVAGVKTDQDWCRPDGIRDVGARRTRINRDLFAQ